MSFPPAVSFAGMVAAANPGHLGMLAQMDTDEERMRYVSQLEKVRPGGNEPAWSICCVEPTTGISHHGPFSFIAR